MNIIGRCLQTIVTLLTNVSEWLQGKDQYEGLNVAVSDFHGNSSEDVMEWTAKVLLKMEGKKGDWQLDRRIINYIAGKLTGPAHCWYQSRILRRGIFDNARCLVEEIEREFSNPRKQAMLRNDLDRLSQSSQDVRNYVYQFRIIMNQIKDMNEVDRIHAFCRGLQVKPRQEVEMLGPSYLEEAIAVALRVEDIFLKPLKNVYSKEFVHNEPMELDGITHNTRKFRAKHEGRARNLQRCFVCDSKFHFARNCPDKERQGNYYRA